MCVCVCVCNVIVIVVYPVRYTPCIYNIYYIPLDLWFLLLVRNRQRFLLVAVVYSNNTSTYVQVLTVGFLTYWR